MKNHLSSTSVFPGQSLLRVQAANWIPFPDPSFQFEVLTFEIPFRLPNYSFLEKRAATRQSVLKSWNRVKRLLPVLFSRDKIRPSAYIFPLTTNAPEAERIDGAKVSLGMIWSIGRWLEKKASMWMDVGNCLEGVFLDVVGSLVLVEMKKALTGWVLKNYCEPFTISIIQEFCPGKGGIPLTVQKDLFLTLNRLNLSHDLEIRLDHTLNPRKSCSTLFVLGEGTQNTIPFDSPCSPCAGKSCLYFQLGGCHCGSTLLEKELSREKQEKK